MCTPLKQEDRARRNIYMGFQKQHLTEEKRQRGSPGADGDAEFVPEADSEQSGKTTSSRNALAKDLL